MVYTFITFNSMNGKKKFLRALDKNNLTCWNRSKVRCGCEKDIPELKDKLIGGTYPEILDAPNPTLILWPNLGVGKMSQCCRALAIYLASIVIIALGFVAIIYVSQLKSNQEKNAWQPTSCGNKDFSLAEAIGDYERKEES